MTQKLCESREEKRIKQREVRKKAEAKREERKLMEAVLFNRSHLGSGELLGVRESALPSARFVCSLKSVKTLNPLQCPINLGTL